jgi:uncharacterized membrane protein YkvI
MRSPAAAIAWEFRTRHRWGLPALAGCVTLMAAIKIAILVSQRPVTIDSGVAFALVNVVPLTTMFFYFLAMFSKASPATSRRVRRCSPPAFTHSR